ncbi:hypothetical protein H0H92_014375, partial [Tricholoma furcatifolium]
MNKNPFVPATGSYWTPPASYPPQQWTPPPDQTALYANYGYSAQWQRQQQQQQLHHIQAQYPPQPQQPPQPPYNPYQPAAAYPQPY